MNRHARIRTMQQHIAQPQKERGVLCHADRERRRASRLPLRRPEAGPSHGGIAGQMRTIGEHGSSTLYFCSRENGRPGNTVSLLAGGKGILRSMPSRQVFPLSANSPRIFPAYLRSLARCLSRALRKLRGSASLCNPSRSSADLPGTPALRAPCGFRFPENLLCTERSKHFPDPPKKRRLPLGAGHLTSLRARVSRRQSGQIQTGEKQWHSTETTSR